jgi:hypothetical protein
MRARNSQKTHYNSFTQISRLMLFRRKNCGLLTEPYQTQIHYAGEFMVFVF